MGCYAGSSLPASADYMKRTLGELNISVAGHSQSFHINCSKKCNPLLKAGSPVPGARNMHCPGQFRALAPIVAFPSDCNLRGNVPGSLCFQFIIVAIFYRKCIYLEGLYI